jgi:hypothetical protein
MMDIKTDSSAVIATLNKRIENLERYNLGLANESCQQQRKIAELEARQINYDRLLVMATKWCDIQHHDWQEILLIATGEVKK